MKLPGPCHSREEVERPSNDPLSLSARYQNAKARRTGAQRAEFTGFDGPGAPI
jgi:hypothetical protein